MDLLSVNYEIYGNSPKFPSECFQKCLKSIFFFFPFCFFFNNKRFCDKVTQSFLSSQILQIYVLKITQNRVTLNYLWFTTYYFESFFLFVMLIETCFCLNTKFHGKACKLTFCKCSTIIKLTLNHWWSTIQTISFLRKCLAD